MKVIDGKNAVMGRLASYAAKEALKGEEVVILNCQDVIITGTRSNILSKFQKERGKMGHGMRGPKHIKTSERMVKRVIRGMLPGHKWGRGREAYARIKCYVGIPKEFEGAKKIVSGKERKRKFSKVGEFAK